MRILHVNDEPLTELGGVSRYISRLVAAQGVLGHDAEVIAGFASHVGWRRLYDFWDPAARRHVEAAADAFGADIVHLHSVLRECSVSVTALRGSAPVVMSVHDPKILGETDHGSHVLRGWLDRRVKSPWERRVARKHVALFEAVSMSLLKRCRDAGLTPTWLLRGPTFMPETVGPPPSACYDVLFVGRLARDKGAAELIRAWALLADDWPDFRLVIVGDGPERSRLPSAERVVFAGALDEAGVSAALSRARVLVAPYQPGMQQASSLVAIEAAAHGRPSIVGNPGGAAEILSSLGGGSKLDASDVEMLARSIAKYLSDPDRADQEGERMAQEVAHFFSADVVASLSIKHYEQVLAGTAR